jgi:hypothetical protein
MLYKAPLSKLQKRDICKIMTSYTPFVEKYLSAKAPKSSDIHCKVLQNPEKFKY